MLILLSTQKLKLSSKNGPEFSEWEKMEQKSILPSFEQLLPLDLPHHQALFLHKAWEPGLSGIYSGLDMISNLLKILPAMNLLDYGCGTTNYQSLEFYCQQAVGFSIRPKKAGSLTEQSNILKYSEAQLFSNTQEILSLR